MAALEAHTYMNKTIEKRMPFNLARNVQDKNVAYTICVAIKSSSVCRSLCS